MVDVKTRHRNRYLKIEPGRPIKMRLTVDKGEHLCGERVETSLRTKNIRDARRTRDIVEQFLLKARHVRQKA